MLEYSPVYIVRSGAVYQGCHNEFLSHHDIGDGQCVCTGPSRGTMFILDGERSVYCNICRQNVTRKRYCDGTPIFARRHLLEEAPGYIPDDYYGDWKESDAVFKARILEALRNDPSIVS